jgi:hypothetical protein
VHQAVVPKESSYDEDAQAEGSARPAARAPVVLVLVRRGPRVGLERASGSLQMVSYVEGHDSAIACGKPRDRLCILPRRARRVPENRVETLGSRLGRSRMAG